jgi:DnaJ homolog subfamily C member 1
VRTIFNGPANRWLTLFGALRFQDQALVMAWGETKKPLAGRKRLRVKTGDQEDPLGVPGINKGKPTGPGSVIEMVVEGEKVYIVEDGEGEL